LAWSIRAEKGSRLATDAVPARGLAPLRRLVPYVLRYRGRLWAGLVCVLVSSALGAVGPWILRDALDGLAAGAPASKAYWQGAALIGTAALTGVLRYYMRDILNGLSRSVEYDLRNDLFARLTVLDAGWFARMRTGDVMARVTNDLGAVRMAAGPAIMYLTNTVVGSIFALVFMVRIDARLAGLALLPMVLLPVIMVRMGRAVHERFESVQEHFSTITTAAQENLAGTRIVRAFRQEEAEVARFAALSETYVTRNLRLAQLQGILNPSLSLLAGLGALAVLGYGGRLALTGKISVGAFVAFGLYLGMLTWPLIALGWVINLFQRGAASMQRLLDILDANPVVTDAPNPAALPARTSGGRTIEFRDVGFHYPVADGASPRWVLRHVSFTVPAGTTLGLVGATGSGKSSLLDLIPRLRDPQEGDVLLDGVPLRSLTLDAVRHEIGYVPQESLLFSETIQSNLEYGAEGPDAAERATAAAHIAQLDEAVADFPSGYATILGERGINLSGGQKQRAAIARALAREPAVVLLDDALSAVDTQTEAAILAGLGSALARRTAIIASHRVSALRDADAIIVLDDGAIVERGTHAELVARQGRYWQLLRNQQLDESIEDVAAALVAPSA
jgi:ATP-binding cassette subfamily B protein